MSPGMGEKDQDLYRDMISSMNIVLNKSLDMVYEGRSNIKKHCPHDARPVIWKEHKILSSFSPDKHRRTSISDSVGYSPAIFRSSSFSST